MRIALLIKIHNRAELEKLAARMSEISEIKAIIEFKGIKMRIYCIFSKEAIDLMQGNRGKMAAQAGHAYLHSYWDAQERFPEAVSAYRSGLARKICLIVPTTEELINIYFSAREQGHPCTQVRESAFTVFDKPTLTCIGIGPVQQMTFENSKMFI